MENHIYCEYIGCEGSKNFCKHSGCKYHVRGGYCNEIRFPGSIYCGSHICGVYGCAADIHCYDHTCRVKQCYKKVFNANAKYCAIHICKIGGCADEMETCKEHKCIVLTCERSRVMEYQVCGFHLSYYEIMQALYSDRKTYISILPRDIVKIIYAYARAERHQKFPYIEP